MKEQNEYHAIGVMSGTSLDGLDIAFCRFWLTNKWHWSILKAVTIPYSNDLSSELEHAHLLDSNELEKLDLSFGRFIGQKVASFLEGKDLPHPDLVASHGHTVHHRPEGGVTVQIGNGQEIANAMGIKCINDFRSLDVSLGGQGAPLVPIGDRLLFGEFDACVNLGGFANISYERRGKRLAYDICPVNMALNTLAGRLGQPYDSGGELAAEGTIDRNALKKLNRLEFYQQSPPRSLGREWFEENMRPILDSFEDPKTGLRTVVEHIAMQIAQELKGSSSALLTGGGARNTFLIQRLDILTNSELVLPDDQLIDQKEALVFAFLGVLKDRGEVNCLQSVTGATRDSSGGQIWFPQPTGDP